MIPTAFLDALQSGAVAVTVNRRLSRTLRTHYDQRQTDLGKKAWPTPQILPWDAWLIQIYRQLRSVEEHPQQLLGAEQSLCLWCEIVAKSDSAGSLLNSAAAASIAQSAWALQHIWGLNPSEFRLSSDQCTYMEWARQYQHRCERNNWLDINSLHDWLAVRFTGDARALPEQLLVVGFDTVSPAQTSVLEALENRGVEILFDDLAGDDKANSQRLVCEDEREELLAVANWARVQLESQTSSRIGIVVLDLPRRREKLLEALDETLDPGCMLNNESKASQYYNISLGLPLSDYPMVDDALHWLALICRPQPLERCTRLLLSPYLSAASSERNRRARADFQLRRRGATSFSLHTLARSLRQQPLQCPEILCARLTELIGDCDELPRRQSCAAWSRSIAKLLERIGWPGESVLSSEEFQLHGVWQRILQRLVEFDTVGSVCSLSEALAHLTSLARGTVFQVESANESRLQILGLLEVAGMRFDALWVMGVDEHNWPQRPHLNPFLPLGAQRAAKLPHSSAAWEAEFARRSMGRLLGCAELVVFSYACNDGDAQRAASPLLETSPPFDCATTLQIYRGPAYEMQARSSPLEVEHDNTAPTLASGTAVRGGVSVLSDQAECPFRAFARHRLCAEPFDQPHSGISASERGSLLHVAMQHLWHRLQSRTGLLSLDSRALHDHIEDAVKHAINISGGAADSAFHKLESTHLAELIAAWLALEKTREPFDVESLEQRHTLEIGGMALELRVDRTDLLAGGERFTIDYKTGVPNSQDWMKRRPRDVQLPLYVLADPQPVAAVALAYVRPQQSTFAGVSESATNLSGVALCTAKFRGDGALQFENWSELNRHWRSEITALAEEFVGGIATVTPRDFPNTCKFCALDALCRVRDADSSLQRRL